MLSVQHVGNDRKQTVEYVEPLLKEIEFGDPRRSESGGSSRHRLFRWKGWHPRPERLSLRALGEGQGRRLGDNLHGDDGGGETNLEATPARGAQSLIDDGDVAVQAQSTMIAGAQTNSTTGAQIPVDVDQTITPHLGVEYIYIEAPRSGEVKA